MSEVIFELRIDFYEELLNWSFNDLVHHELVDEVWEHFGRHLGDQERLDSVGLHRQSTRVLLREGVCQHDLQSSQLPSLLPPLLLPPSSLTSR